MGENWGYENEGMYSFMKLEGECYGLNASFQNSYIEVLMPSMIALQGGCLGGG